MDHGTVLVTGCAGFIGSHTTDRLLESGRKVVGADDLSTGEPVNLQSSLKHPDFTFVECDLTIENCVDRMFDKYCPEIVVHLAGLVDVKAAEEDPLRNQKLNVAMTAMIAQSAVRHEVRRLVFASSAAVYGDSPRKFITEQSDTRPIGNYGRSKLECERMLKEIAGGSPIEVVSLRYFNVFGRRQSPRSPYAGVLSVFLEQFRTGRAATVFGDGFQTRDFVAVEDVSLANSLAVNKSGLKCLTANICTGRSHSLLDVLEILRRCFPRAPEPEFYPAQDKDIRHSCGDPRIAAKALGFRPTISLEQGLMALAESRESLSSVIAQ